jgi:hypothetical protein
MKILTICLSALCCLFLGLWIYKPQNRTINKIVDNCNDPCKYVTGGYDNIRLCYAGETCKKGGGRLLKYDENVGDPKFECDYGAVINQN